MLRRFIYRHKVDKLIDKIMPSALIYTLLFYLPTTYYLAHERAGSNLLLKILLAAAEISTTFLLITLIFTLVARIGKYTLYIVVALFYGVGGITIYFLLNFGKNLGIWSIQSMLYDERNFIEDMMGAQLILIISISIMVGILSIYSHKIKLKKSINIVLISSCGTILGMTGLGTLLFHSILNNYAPYPEIKGLTLYFLHNEEHFEGKIKNDISKIYDFVYKPKTQDPLTVIMVIGESLRGDILEINGYNHFANANTPYSENITNLVSFKYAKSHASSTKRTIPQMLTRNFYDEQNSRNIPETTFISVFRKLGFKTAWIGAQSSFSSSDIYISSIPREAEYIITRKEIMGRNGRHNIYDGDMLPIIKQFLDQNKSSNKLLIIHMIGSHWRFDHRYPSGFGAFYPICRHASPTSCTKPELENSYHNTVLYTDFFLYNLIKMIDHDSSFLFFASDHGSQITENHFEDSEDRLEEGMDADMTSIAMITWASNKFLQYYEKSYNNLSMKKDYENISHYNIFHSVLGCLGIESLVIDNNLNLCR